VSVQGVQVQLTIESDPAEVGRARRWARARLVGSGVARNDEQLTETVVLLVSELVTNAVVHTGSPAVLSMSFPGPPGPEGEGAAREADVAAGGGGCALRVEVVDVSRTAPAPRHAKGEDTGGRGLELVSGLADRWGWHHDGEGKRVWCEFDRVRGEAAAEPPSARAQGFGATAGQVPPPPRTAPPSGPPVPAPPSRTAPALRPAFRPG
jgi:hypothetical protein